MTRLARITFATALAVAMAGGVTAQDALAKRVSLDLKAMPPADAFKIIAQAIGHTVAVAPEVTTPVDIVIRNVTARTALNTICESIGCSWRVSGTAITVSEASGIKVGMVVRDRPGTGTGARQARPVETSERVVRLKARLDQKLPPDMVFDNTPLPEVAERLSKATRLEISISADLAPGQTFSADLGNRPFTAALTALSQQLEGNVVCRIGLPKDASGSREAVIAIQITKKTRR